MESFVYTAKQLLSLRTPMTKGKVSDKLQKRLQNDLSLDVLRLSTNHSLPSIEEEPHSAATHLKTDKFQDLFVENQLDGTSSEWQYRGRTKSEQSESQPISAPTGLSAQHDEGFRRFYKAVVSPTHVRVTAGGRIVPNTRIPLSPTTKWPRERQATSGTLPSLQTNTRELFEPSHQAYQPSHFTAFPALFPGFAPGLAPVFGTPAAFSWNPWQLGLNMCSSPFGIPPVSLTTTNSHLEAKDTLTSDKKNKKSSLENAKADTISSVDHPVDHSQPYFYNGQWIMPSNSSLLQYGMTPVPNFTPSTSIAQPPNNVASRIGFRPEHTPGVAALSRSQIQQTWAAPSSKSHDVKSVGSLSNPPISSIRPSQITIKQIEVLRGTLRYLEDQLQYNRHQIDERWMDHQAQLVRKQIQQFEKNLESQRDYEKSHYPTLLTSNMGGSQGSITQVTESSQSTSEFTNDHHTEANRESLIGIDIGSTLTDKTLSKIATSSRAHPTERVAPDESMAINGKTIATLDDNGEPVKKSSALPVHAALAPPFQPRTEFGLEIEVSSEPKYSSTSSRKEEEALMPDSVRLSPNTDRFFSAYQADTPPVDLHSNGREMSSYANMRDHTEDEMRARQMYWGNTPSDVQGQGPRFDDKRFYSASPERVHISSEFAQSGSNPTSPLAQPVLDGFRSLSPRIRRTDRLRFGQVTQSEALHQPSISSTETSTSVSPRPGSCITSVGPIHDTLFPALAINCSGDSEHSNDMPPLEDGDGDKSIVFKGRKSIVRTKTRTRNEVWQNMLRKGKASANAIPNTVSSTTVQAELPQYAGHAAAYLTPTLGNACAPTPLHQAKKMSNANDFHSLNLDKSGENIPPIEATKGKDLKDSNFGMRV